MAEKSESPVTARAQLDERNAKPEDNLKEQVKEQEKQQRDELREGAKAKAGEAQKHIDDDNVIAARKSGDDNTKVDQLARRSGADALEGHFCRIDLNHKGVKAAYKQTQGLEDHDGDYGVFLNVTESDSNGYPVTATVRLRDDTNALVSVPYEALRPSEAGHR